MVNVDAFESAFRSASRQPFRFEAPPLRSVLIVADVQDQALEDYGVACKAFLAPALGDGAVRFDLLSELTGLEAVLARVEELEPDLIVSYRNLVSDAWTYAFSLGVYLNALTRGTERPVLVTPSPRAYPSMAWSKETPGDVMVLDEDLTNDDNIVNWAARCTTKNGRLHLTHVENDEIFERYMKAIGKIPEIDTEAARELLLEQLMKDPRDYMASVERALQEAGAALEVRSHIGVGHRVADLRDVIAEENIDLVVLPTLEEDRIALHGASYSLAVQLTETPILMV